MGQISSFILLDKIFHQDEFNQQIQNSLNEKGRNVLVSPFYITQSIIKMNFAPLQCNSHYNCFKDISKNLSR